MSLLSKGRPSAPTAGTECRQLGGRPLKSFRFPYRLLSKIASPIVLSHAVQGPTVGHGRQLICVTLIGRRSFALSGEKNR
jgi:hypothetical protein